MNIDQATRDRAVAVMLGVAEDETVDAETRLSAAQALVFYDTEAQAEELNAAIREAVEQAMASR